MGKYCRQHIGKTFNDGKLVVVDGGDKGGCVKVKCKVCAEDHELFGDAIFERQFAELNKGILPCGCAKFVHWTLAQHQIRINRKIIKEQLPIKFIGFDVVVTQINRTPVRFYCKRSDSEYKIERVQAFYRGVGNNGAVSIIGERLAKYSKLNPNYRVWETGNKSRHGVSIVGFYCGVCESKGYESLFTISSASLLVGRIPCYCSPKMSSMSGDHVVEVSKMILEEQGVRNVYVVGAVKKALKWHVVFLCKQHGIYSRFYDKIGKTGCYCIKCAPPKTGYNSSKQGSLYLLEIQTDSTTILGYGITNKLNNRLTTHRKNLNNLGYKILSTRVFEGSGTKVLAVENSIKALHKTGLIDCEGFRRESISIDRKDEVLELCKTLKEKL